MLYPFTADSFSFKCLGAWWGWGQNIAHGCVCEKQVSKDDRMSAVWVSKPWHVILTTVYICIVTQMCICIVMYTGNVAMYTGKSSLSCLEGYNFAQKSPFLLNSMVIKINLLLCCFFKLNLCEENHELYEKSRKKYASKPLSVHLVLVQFCCLF